MTTKTPKLPRETRGKRPQFFSDPGIDQLYSITLELSAELSVALDRIDTLERLLDERDVASLSEIHNFEPDAAVETARTEGRDRYLQRIFRVLSYDDPADDTTE
jgi:hypothetical protein